MARFDGSPASLSHTNGRIRDARFEPGHDIRIRRFHDADSETLAALVARTLRARLGTDYTPRALQRVVAELSASELRRLSRRRYLVVAAAGDRLLGTASLDRHWLYAVVVADEAQRLGIGTRRFHANTRHPSAAVRDCAG